MRIGSYYDALELHRKEKIFFAQFLRPHRVLSTCRFNGGLREDLEFLYNHQSCEPSKHVGTDLCEVAVKDPERYQKRIASKAGLPYERSASLGTAANMNNSAIARESDAGLEVIAFCTAGVGSNAGRAGDPASYRQTKDGIQIISRPPPAAGTINILVFVSEEITAGALVSAATLIAEAKASVLHELAIPSRYSDGIATGTGTDQIGIAAQLGTEIVHTDSNKHSKLGELIGKSVRAALQQALNLQNGMTPDSRRSCIMQLQRFGETQAAFIDGVKRHLDADTQALFESNFLSVNHDPMTVAAVQGCLHQRDQIVLKIIPESCGPEILLGQAAQIACAVSAKGLHPMHIREQLDDVAPGLGSQDILELVRRSIAYGYSQKWANRFED